MGLKNRVIMKKIFILLSFFIVLGVTMNSCISEMIPEPTDPPDGPDGPDVPNLKTFYLYFYSAQIDKINTFAYPNLGLPIPAILWGSEEYTGVFMIREDNTTLYSNRKYFINDDRNATGRRTALLLDTITSLEQNVTCYGYYPYQSTMSETTAINKLDWIQDQSADNTSNNLLDQDISHNLFMIAPTSEPFSINGETGVINFKSIFSILRFQVTKSPEYTNFGEQKIKKVQMYIADKSDLSVPLSYDLAGDYSIDVSNAIGTLNYKGPTFTNGKNVITATVTGGNAIREDESISPNIWFIVNPFQLKSNECLVIIVETNQFRIISSHDISEIKANTVYIIPVVAKQSNTVSDQVVTKSFLKDEAANCYVISKAGLYQIPLYTTKGVKIQGKSVDWLWASKENGGTDFNIAELIDETTFVYHESATNDYENYIQFRVGTDFGKYTKGNVILALRNTAGAIVWSWHIWITDQPKDISYYTDTGIQFLDRNIGAVSADAVSPMINNFGFVYQWGRKDPFIGGDGIQNETTANVLSIAKNNSIQKNPTVDKWEFNWQSTSDDFAKQHPMTFICNYTPPPVDLDNPVDWLTPANSTRWSEKDKTENDPCPYGYKVPSRADLIYLHEAKYTNWYFQNQNNWYWEYRYMTNEKTTVWPTAGMRQGRYDRINGNDGGQLICSGTTEKLGQCFYWTSTPAVAKGKPGGSHRVYTSVTPLLHNQDDFGDNADAYPVRCVKMKP